MVLLHLNKTEYPDSVREKSDLVNFFTGLHLESEPGGKCALRSSPKMTLSRSKDFPKLGMRPVYQGKIEYPVNCLWWWGGGVWQEYHALEGFRWWGRPYSLWRATKFTKTLTGARQKRVRKDVYMHRVPVKTGTRDIPRNIQNLLSTLKWEP